MLRGEGGGADFSAWDLGGGVDFSAAVVAKFLHPPFPLINNDRSLRSHVFRLRFESVESLG